MNISPPITFKMSKQGRILSKLVSYRNTSTIFNGKKASNVHTKIGSNKHFCEFNNTFHGGNQLQFVLKPHKDIPERIGFNAELNECNLTLECNHAKELLSCKDLFNDFCDLINKYGIAIVNVNSIKGKSNYDSHSELIRKELNSLKFLGEISYHEKSYSDGILLIDPENPNSIGVKNTRDEHAPHTDGSYKVWLFLYIYSYFYVYIHIFIYG